MEQQVGGGGEKWKLEVLGTEEGGLGDTHGAQERVRVPGVLGGGRQGGSVGQVWSHEDIYVK